MHWIVPLAIMLGLASAATAAETAPGYEAYRLGMSIEEARAITPRATTLHNEDGLVVLGAQTPVVIDGAQFSPLLEFRDGVLTRLQLSSGGRSRDLAQCEGAFVGILPAFERDGPFNGPRTLAEPQTAPIESVTAGGSQLRRYSAGVVTRIFTNRRAAIYTEASVRFGALTNVPGAYGAFCLMEVSFTTAPPLTYAELAADLPSTAELEAATLIERPQWTGRPGADAFARYYPPIALEAGVQGRVVLDCLVREDGHLRCAPIDEEPAEQGFGLAALAIGRGFQMAAEIDGEATAGRRVRVPIRFAIGQ